jgi:hypothetical protein
MIPAPRTDEEIPGYLARLGIPGLADVHVHFVPELVLFKVWDYFVDAAEAGEEARLGASGAGSVDAGGPLVAAAADAPLGPGGGELDLGAGAGGRRVAHWGRWIRALTGRTASSSFPVRGEALVRLIWRRSHAAGTWSRCRPCRGPR